MKTKISDNGDYAIFAELKTLEVGSGYSLKFTSKLKSANTTDEQNKLEIFLSKSELEKLKELFN